MYIFAKVVHYIFKLYKYFCVSPFVTTVTKGEMTKPKQQKRSKYKKHKEAARKLVHTKLSYWNSFYGFTYHRVAIRDQKTRWGSCSSKGNLNFSYKILFLDEELQDYLIVHELCHLKELNHSKRFWDEVVKTIPEYKKHRKRLRVHSVPD